MLIVPQNLTVCKNNKELYGEIPTPYILIDKMLDYLPISLFSNPNLLWLDSGCGKGYFSIKLYNKLFVGLSTKIIDEEERKSFILQKMIYMIDILDHSDLLKQHFKFEKLNFINTNYINYKTDLKFDIILGNPPFNNGTIKKVPTNTVKNKKKDGTTVWYLFIKKSIELLKDKGFLLYITPAIWMRPDKKLINQYMLQFKIHKLEAFSNTDMNKLFNKHCQTPCSIFLLQKTKLLNHFVNIYDTISKQFINYYIYKNIIPMKFPTTFSKLGGMTKQYGCIKIHKSNLPSKFINLSSTKNNIYKYTNIKTCIQFNKSPQLVFQYSDKPCPFYNKTKLVLAHGMYGFPYLDKSGEYGISNRDKFIITDYPLSDLLLLKDFFSSNFIMELYKATRYRMMYIDKHIFELLPDITKIPNFSISQLQDN